VLIRLLRRLVVGVLCLAGLAAIVVGASLMAGGIGARQPPGRLETTMAPRLRSLAIPVAARQLKNPVPMQPAAVAEGMEHFADHCAVCHGNDGSGDTEMGHGLYPRVPDMRQAGTQDLSDGELFYIIENGVKLTGMPAWATGTPEGEQASWRLVHFIRHLPRLTDAELARMKDLNPKTPEEWKDEEETRRFLEESAPPARPAARPSHKHGEPK
jgi:mono/diheme cytochrome c family protein